MHRSTPEEKSEWSSADWAVEGFRFIVDSNFKQGDHYRKGVSYLLSAIIYDVQDDNYWRASNLADLTRPLIELMQDETAEPILVGIGFEWFGDIDLLLGNESAIDHYEQAEPYFKDTDWQDEIWKFEPVFEISGHILRHHLESQGYDLPISTYTHAERVARKIELAEEILNDNE